jgi:hypothetical protein
MRSLISTNTYSRVSLPYKLPVLLLIALITLGTRVVPAFSKNAKTNFSGHWELDKAKSDLGGAPPVNTILEVIDQDGSTIVITTTYVSPRGSMKRVAKLTTDGAANINMVTGHEVTTRTHWDGGSLVTVVRDPRGLQLTETRALSRDGKTMTVSIDSGFHKQRLVMRKK